MGFTGTNKRCGFHSFIFHSFHVSMSSCIGLKSGILKNFILLSKPSYGLFPVLEEACAKGKAYFRRIHSWIVSSVGTEQRGKCPGLL